ncbi:MAG: O-methyltransferase [Anaerolineales bacterium]|nr:O-methyltransferase [Anaerolineales bacterium]
MSYLFADLPKPLLERMSYLEARDGKDRQDGTPRLKRMRQVPPETGMLLALLAGSAPEGALIEIGTSGGYSALWLSLAVQRAGTQLVTFELLPEKAEIARETFEKAEVGNKVQLINGDARGHLSSYEGIAFAFVDCEKEMYAELYEEIVPRLAAGGILVADNAISHADDLAALLQRARADERVDMTVLPVGKGLMVCVKRTLTSEAE